MKSFLYIRVNVKLLKQRDLKIQWLKQEQFVPLLPKSSQWALLIRSPRDPGTSTFSLLSPLGVRIVATPGVQRGKGLRAEVQVKLEKTEKLLLSFLLTAHCH